MEGKVEELLSKYIQSSRGNLIPILQEIQDEVGYLSQEAIVSVGEHLDIPTSKIYSLATFYNQFRFQPRGRYHIQLCHGTACHIMGANSLIDYIEKTLKVKAGQTSSNGLFSLEVMPCIGACSLSPVIAINGKYHGKLTLTILKSILQDIMEE